MFVRISHSVMLPVQADVSVNFNSLTSQVSNMSLELNKGNLNLNAKLIKYLKSHTDGETVIAGKVVVVPSVVAVTTIANQIRLQTRWNISNCLNLKKLQNSVNTARFSK